MKNAIIQQRVLGMVSTNVYVCMHAETKEAFIVDPADDADEIIRLVSAMVRFRLQTENREEQL